MPTQNQGKIAKTMKLRLLFHEYYANHPDSISVPEQIHTREFAIQTWEQNWHCIERRGRDESGTDVRTGCGKSGKSFQPITECPTCQSKDVRATSWIRHIGYRSANDMVKDLTISAPESVYHSAAFYKVPTATHMHEKEWLGAELVFDIDADHLELKCAKDHDTWQCNNPGCKKTGTGKPPDVCPVCGDAWYCENPKCSKVGNGKPPKVCPACNSRVTQKQFGFSTRKWICDKCLDVARNHTIKLVDRFLVDDLGFDLNKIQINYSGHRGYHVRVKDPKVYKLDSNARIEIVHYIMGSGFKGEKAISLEKGANRVPARNFPGWNGKVAEAMIEFIQTIDDYTGREKWLTPLKERRLEAIEGLQRHTPILSPKVKGVGPKSWQEIAETAVALYGAEIDRPVTHDIHRVIRLIGSLNGKTGFIVSELTRAELDTFDPFNDAIAFNEGSMKVIFHKASTIPAFRISDETYGPFCGEQVDLPLSAAVFVLCKGVASLE
ncbi:hypothetical protein EU527_10365 [Candidatus Thorarchaeota archaeon]|nr:MAG: hypothetical protein EU527_10365 [Candidatus Thorarchaeota archaeon]